MLGTEASGCAIKQPTVGIQQLSALLECDDTSIALFDKHYICAYSNPAFTDFHHTKSDKIYGHPISDIVGQELFHSVIREQCDRAIHGDNISYEAWLQFPLAGQHFCNISIKPILDDAQNINFFALYLKDLTHSQEHTMRLQEMANTDPLTGIYNRRYFVDFGEREFDRARRYQRPLSMLLFDMNGFKEVNDHFGHAAGDRLLVDVCRGVEKILRSSDCFARVGGDEFAVTLPEQNKQDALGCALRVRNAIQNSFIVEDGQRIQGSASIGVSTLQQGMHAFSYLWKTADFDLYSNKPNAQSYGFSHNKNPQLAS